MYRLHLRPFEDHLWHLVLRWTVDNHHTDPWTGTVPLYHAHPQEPQELLLGTSGFVLVPLNTESLQYPPRET